MAADAPHSDRRSSLRLPIEMWVEDLTDGGIVHRRAGNLSQGGLYLDQTIPLPMGTVVKLRFELPGDPEPLTVSGEIVSVVSKVLGMGVKFIAISPEIQERLNAYVDRLATPIAGTPTG